MHQTHIFIPLGLDKVQLSIVSEGSPLRVDHHVVLLHEVALVQRLDVLHVLEVARVRPGSQDQTDPTPVVLPRAAHEATGGVVEDGAHVDLHVAPLVQGLVQQGHHVLPLNTFAVEALRPPDKAGLCQTLLPGFKVSVQVDLGWLTQLTCRGKRK